MKVLQKGGKSKYVWLLDDGTVKKAYNLKDRKQKIRFDNEVKYMKFLSECDIVPKLLKVDKKEGAIYMSYVGKTPKDTPENRQWLKQTMKKLHKKWNLMRHRNGKPNYDVYMGNACVLNNKMYIIDFGSFHYKIVGPKVTSKN